jgi:hypothetical protein
VTQLRRTSAGRIYYQKKIAEGKTPKEAIRALKRRTSDAVYQQLQHDVAANWQEVGPGGHPGTTLNPAWPACILITGSSDKSLPGPDTNATTIYDTKPADHPNAPDKHSLGTKRLRYGRVLIVGGLVGRSRSVPFDWEYLVDVGEAFEYDDLRFTDPNPIDRASKVSGCRRDHDVATVGGGSNPRRLVHREAE